MAEAKYQLCVAWAATCEGGTGIERAVLVRTDEEVFQCGV